MGIHLSCGARFHNPVGRICLLRIVIPFLLPLLVLLSCSRSRPPYAVVAAKMVDISRAVPVTAEILDLNSLRRTAGLVEVGQDWFTAPTKGVVLYDGPSFTILLDSHRKIAKVVASGAGEVPMYRPMHTEYELSNGKLTGRSATWIESPPLLYEVETYQSNELTGPKVYYDRSGDVICSCEFRRGSPWSGRYLWRDGFDKLLWDVSYSNGKLDGREIAFDDKGLPERVRSFKAGVLHGVQQLYQQGRLIGEEWLWKGETLGSGERAREEFNKREAAWNP